jgi:hypothetical protein
LRKEANEDQKLWSMAKVSDTVGFQRIVVLHLSFTFLLMQCMTLVSDGDAREIVSYQPDLSL